MAKRKIRGEFVRDDEVENTELKKNDIIISIDKKTVGILDTNIESLIYNKPIGTEVVIKYYKHIPENGMCWSSKEYTTTIITKEFPDEKDKAIYGRSKIQFN